MSHASGKGSLLVVFLAVFIDLLGFGMVLPLLPIYAQQFAANYGLSGRALGWTIGGLMASFSAMQFFFSPLWGRVSDRFGRRPVILIGLAGSTFFYALFGVATLNQSLEWLFIARIGAGISGATIATAQAYIADTTTRQSRARGMALIGAAFGLGFTFGPLLGAAALVFSPDVGVSPWPGYTASALSAGALLLAVFKLPESLRPESARAGQRLFDPRSWGDALATPSVGALLATSFISVLSFGSFEQTLSLLLNSERGGFGFEYHQVLLFFAFVGLVLSAVQGFLVRRLATRLSEPALANIGAVLSILGFALLAWAATRTSLGMLLVASATEVTGFAFMTPSLAALISRRSDPARQGAILGVAQSISSLARIVGPLVSIPLFYIAATLPYWVALGLMCVALALVGVAARGGHDFAATGET
ncbi:MAG: MFS transporter [Pirellulales bacterium]